MSLRNWLRPARNTTRHTAPRPRARLGLDRLEDRLVPAGIPVLNSLPGAPATIYLDFDGHFEASWGAYSNITTPAFNQDGDPTSFGDSEIATIQAVWARTAEDFAPFNINVTTVEPAVLAPGVPAANANGKALRVCIGGDNSWLGGYGGYAYINAFTNSVPNVCYVFDNSGTGSSSWFADAASHEAGHSFGLNHVTTYDANGDSVAPFVGTWSPIMWASALSIYTMTWQYGTTSSPTTFQDDMAVIASATNGFGYRPDDHGNTTGTASPLAASGGVWSGSGVVGTNTDVDFHSFTVTAADTFRITVGGPGAANGPSADANLDAVIELRNGAGQLLETTNPSTTTDARIVRALTPGTYTIAVKSTGVYGRIGAYAVTVDAPPAGVTVTPASGAMTTHEDGRGMTFTVVLETAPVAPVTIPISSSNPAEGAVSTSSLTFTAANWNVPQTVTLTGVADGAADGDTAYTVVLGTASTTDPEYAGYDPADVGVVNADLDLSGFLYRVDSLTDTIERGWLNGSHGGTVLDLKPSFGFDSLTPNGMVVDGAGRMYWIDNTADAIYRAELDGSGAVMVLSLAGGTPWGLALDAAAGKLYWTDTLSTAKAIRRANLDGTGVETVLTTANAPYGIAVDPAAGKMYWSEVIGNAGSIHRANLDGSSVETLYTGGMNTSAMSIALDPVGGKLYWAASNLDRIYRSDLNGSNLEVVVDTAAISPTSMVRGLTLDLAAGKMYWMDSGLRSLYRANLDGSNVATLTTFPSSASSLGLAIVRPAAGVSVTGRTGLVTTEGSSGTSFRVVLNTRPTANVTIPVSSSDTTEGTVSVTSLTFRPDNWFVPQTVTVNSVEDTSVDGHVAYSIVLGTTSSADPVYHGLNPADASATSIDNDTVKFFVVDDASANRTYRYGAPVNSLTNSTMNSGNSAPRGAASTAAGDKVWVVDANKKVYVYSAAGALLGSWKANGLASNATVEGITVHGNDVWILDAGQDRVYCYANAAGRTSGSQSATSNFALHTNDTGAKDLVTDGTHIWVVDDQPLDKVYKYTVAGTYVGAWAIDAANGSPTGITLDPANPRHLWIVDNGTDRVYQYDYALGRTSGSLAASTSYALVESHTVCCRRGGWPE